MSTAFQMTARIAQPVYTTASCAEGPTDRCGSPLLYYSTGTGGPFLGGEMPGEVPDRFSEQSAGEIA